MKSIVCFYVFCIVQLIACGCASNTSVKGSPYKSATFTYSTDTKITSYKEEYLKAISDHLLKATSAFVSGKGDLHIVPTCDPDGLQVKSTITSLNMPSMKKGEYANITITGEFIKCGSAEILGTFYQHEDGKNATEELDMIARDIVSDVYKFIYSTIK